MASYFHYGPAIHGPCSNYEILDVLIQDELP
jgi:hypothetical protein